MPDRRRLIFHGAAVSLLSLVLTITGALAFVAIAPRSWSQWIVDLGPLAGAILLGVLLYLPTKLLTRETAITCPTCNQQTLQAEGDVNGEPIRHNCSNCGAKYLDGELIGASKTPPNK